MNPFGARLNALFGSAIGHFDVPDMLDVLPEAYELLEDGLDGTVVEKPAAAVLAEMAPSG